MKKILSLILIGCLVFGLVACGSAPKQEETKPAETAATEAPEQTTEATEAVTEAASETAAEETKDETAEKIAIANSLIDAPIQDLYDAIGYPTSSDYAPSCLKLGADDGILTYDGFIVYTIREGDTETVYYVE